MSDYPFSHVVGTTDELEAIVGLPMEGAIKKQLPTLDAHCRALIARSPFLLVGTASAAGDCDVSPRGDGPGFVKVLDDHTLVIPERPGNRRVDSLRNVIENPHVGLLFLIPPMEETLRVNGRARIVRDPDLMSALAYKGKTPLLGLAITVEEAFIHCAKAFKRSGLWQPASWRDPDDLPSIAQIFIDQLKLKTTVAEFECEMDVAYTTTLY